MKDISSTFDSVSTERQNQSVNETVSKESPRLLDFIRRRIPNADDAEDILQDVLHQLVETSRLKPVEQVTSWLFKVARNKITDRFRKKKTESLERQMVHGKDDEGENLNLADLLPTENDSPEMLMFRTAFMEELETALDELPDEQREVFIMHEVEGLSFNEISAITGAGVNTLLSRKRYAVLYLRERLRDLYDELTTD